MKLRPTSVLIALALCMAGCRQGSSADAVRHDAQSGDTVAEPAMPVVSDSLPADSAVAPTQPKPEAPKRERYSWWKVEDMVRCLTNENYYACIWKVDDGSSAWIAIYEKGNRYYISRFNPETGRYGAKTRLQKLDVGLYCVYGNKSRKYKYSGGNDLVYEVNGEERERFINFHLIDLDTPETDGYEDVDDEFNDNEEDIYLYYNG